MQLAALTGGGISKADTTGKAIAVVNPIRRISWRLEMPSATRGR